MAKKEDRFEQIRKVRSFNDLMEIVGDIQKDVESGTKLADRLLVSVSAATKDQTFTIQHAPGRIRKISTKSSPAKIDFSGKVKKFKVPPKADIEKHTTVLQNLYDNAKELSAVEAMLAQQFAGIAQQKNALQGVIALRESVEKSIKTALDALNRVATKHFPSEMEALRDHLSGYLIRSLPKDKYEDIVFLEYVSLGRPGEIVFSVYIKLDLLKNNHGYVFDEYFIILTGVINSKAGIAYFVNALPDFKVPGKYPLGKQIASETELVHRVQQLLAHNDVTTELDRAPMPVHDSADAKSRGFNAIRSVKSSRVKDDALYLEISETTTPATQKRIAYEAIALLNQIMRRKKDASISWKKVKLGSKPCLKFILYFKPGAAPTNINVARLNEVSHILNMDDAQMRKLRQSLLD